LYDKIDEKINQLGVEFDTFLVGSQIPKDIQKRDEELSEKFNYSSHSNIMCLTNPELEEKGIHFYSLLKQTDALITDYSSVFFDYLLLDKPLAFTIDDIDSYSGNRGFVFENPLDYMPGEKIKNSEEFFSFIDNCVNGLDEFKSQRLDINDKVNYYKDNKNCERIIKFVGIEK